MKYVHLIGWDQYGAPIQEGVSLEIHSLLARHISKLPIKGKKYLLQGLMVRGKI